MTFIAQIIYDSIMLAAGCFLVYTEHYGWAWIPFLVILTVSFKRHEK